MASLKVIGPTSVRDYSSTSPLRQIAEELDVGSVAITSVEIVGNRLRVSVRLVDPVTGWRLWAQTYDRTLDDAFAVQSDIARQIVDGVGATLSTAEEEAIAAAPTQNKQAYAFYLQGRDYYWRPGFLRSNLEAAQQLYQASPGARPCLRLGARGVVQPPLRDVPLLRSDPRQTGTGAARSSPGAPTRTRSAAGASRGGHGALHDWRRSRGLGRVQARTGRRAERRRAVDLDREREPRPGQLGQRAGGGRSRAEARPTEWKHVARHRGQVSLPSSVPGGHRGIPPCARTRARPDPNPPLDGLELHIVEGPTRHAPRRAQGLAAGRRSGIGRRQHPGNSNGVVLDGPAPGLRALAPPRRALGGRIGARTPPWLARSRLRRRISSEATAQARVRCSIRPW